MYYHIHNSNMIVSAAAEVTFISPRKPVSALKTGTVFISPFFLKHQILYSAVQSPRKYLGLYP